MLGIGLMLYCLRGLKPDAVWQEGLLRCGFWSMNIGLGLMAVLTLLPMGVLQLEANLERGYWYARSAEFMNRPIIDMLGWLRVPGDTLFAVGALLVAWFVAQMWISPGRETMSAMETARAGWGRSGHAEAEVLGKGGDGTGRAGCRQDNIKK